MVAVTSVDGKIPRFDIQANATKDGDYNANTIGCFVVGLINDACSLRFLLLSQLTGGLRIAQMIDYTGMLFYPRPSLAKA